MVVKTILQRHRTIPARAAGWNVAGRAGTAQVCPFTDASRLATRSFPGGHPRCRRAAAPLSSRRTTSPSLLTVRASGLARHAGQISLPGGATDPGETLSEAALREACRGNRSSPVLGPHSWGADAGARPRQRVYAPSGRGRHRPASGLPAGARAEVDEILEISLSDLRDASRIGRGTRIREGVAVEYPYFDLLGHQVWGATAMVLGEFICLI